MSDAAPIDTAAAVPLFFETRSTELPPELENLGLGDLLLRYQGRAIELLHSTALLVVEKSRRIGLTFGMAAEAVVTASTARGEGGMNVYYISYAQAMTREFIDACGVWAKAIHGAVTKVNETLFSDPGRESGDPDKHIKAFRVDFASGFSIVALSSAPRSLRGIQGLVIIDEAAFVNDLGELLKAAMAMLMWGGKVVVISTHNGAENPFNVLLDDIRSGRRKGKTLTVTFDDALADGLFERIQLVSGGRMDHMTREQFAADVRAFYGDDADEELDCKPRTGSGSWLELADITAAQSDEAGLPEHYAKGSVYVGRDVARRRDLSVIWPFEDVAGTLWLRERIEMKGQTFKTQEAEFDRVMKQYRVARALIDQTGMGEKVVEDAQERHGEERVQGVLFTAQTKLDMATVLKTRFEDGTIRVPRDPAIRRDLMSIKKVKSTGDRVLLAEDGSSDGHADRFWAAALACLAAAGGDAAIAFASTGLRGSMLGERPAAGGAGFGSVAGYHDLGGY